MICSLKEGRINKKNILRSLFISFTAFDEEVSHIKKAMADKKTYSPSSQRLKERATLITSETGEQKYVIKFDFNSSWMTLTKSVIKNYNTYFQSNYVHMIEIIENQEIKKNHLGQQVLQPKNAETPQIYNYSFRKNARHSKAVYDFIKLLKSDEKIEDTTYILDNETKNDLTGSIQISLNCVVEPVDVLKELLEVTNNFVQIQDYLIYLTFSFSHFSIKSFQTILLDADIQLFSIFLKEVAQFEDSIKKELEPEVQFKKNILESIKLIKNNKRKLNKKDNTKNIKKKLDKNIKKSKDSSSITDTSSTSTDSNQLNKIQRKMRKLDEQAKAVLQLNDSEDEDANEGEGEEEEDVNNSHDEDGGEEDSEGESDES